MTEPPNRELAVFSIARRLPAGERATYLDEACAGDAALTQRGIPGTGFIKISCALPGRQPPGNAKNGQFAIRRFCHVQTASLSALQCENPEQKAQRNSGRSKSGGAIQHSRSVRKLKLKGFQAASR